MAGQVRKHELSFCADVKAWADALFADHPEWPFAEAYIEEYGKGSSKRQDLAIRDRTHRTPLLTGEVKMPGTPEGRSPYDPALMQDAFLKADNVQAPYFFTWNVNRLVLFDRSRYKLPMIERRVREWDLGLRLDKPGDCARPEVRAHIRADFLPRFFAEFAAIVTEPPRDWGMAPDEIFLSSLDSHLDWPVVETRDYLAVESQEDRAFAARLQSWMADEMQWTFDFSDPENWADALERAARTLCYVFSNRCIFYKAIQARYSDTLSPLAMPARTRNAEAVYEAFRKHFAAAVSATGDYEPVFYPDILDWAGALVFASPYAWQGWKGFFRNLGEYDFRRIPYDIVGGIFQKLISPEERHKFGQFFTHQDIVDVINAFCIRRAGDVVLDPACGSGSFLVRAYHRKAWLSQRKSGGRRHQDHDKHHHELLREIYGCDIALFPAHLATLNLAARQISDEENFPLIRRGNFFAVAENPGEFCTVPGPRPKPEAERQRRAVPLPELDAVVGNPPYVRQEHIDKRSGLGKGKNETKASFESRQKNTKDFFQELVSRLWPGLKLSGRADLHCYFWPVATSFLKEGGHLGFLTSSSWLDVEYGFALQGWILQNFKLIAVLESVDEPWFEDARIKTCVTILQRCSAKAGRDANTVRFVRLQKPLADILGDRPHGDEAARQEAAERLRQLVESSQGFEDDSVRIIAVPQSQLWQEGVQAGKLLAKGRPEASKHDEAVQAWRAHGDQYAAGKWGRFLRAPDIYFRIMRDYGHRFVKLGQIAEIRRGITSGCDAFFMPRDVTEEVLAQVEKGLPWKDIGLMTPCRLHEVQSGQVRIVRAGDNTIHPIEAEYLRPEVHSLMQVDRPVVRAADTNRVVLWVNKELKELSGTYVAKYIRWGAKQTFSSKKSKAVPVPHRSTVAARPNWYDLTGGERGAAFWPKAQQYRHVIPDNPSAMICNCNLYDLIPDPSLSKPERSVLPATLNSTFVALFKTYYGRYAGTEGNLKTEVVDVKLLEVPDVRGVSKHMTRRILDAFAPMQRRPTQPLVEAEFMRCHSVEHAKQLAQRPVRLSEELRQPDRRALDDAVLEMIGVADPKKRASLLDELYLETARHYRQVRIVEVQKQVQRAGGQRRPTAEGIAGSIWDSFSEEERGPTLEKWLQSQAAEGASVHIPDGTAEPLGKGHMFDPAGVDFRQGKTFHHETYANPEQAALVAALANLEIRGEVDLPTDQEACRELLRKLQKRLGEARSMFQDVTASRTGNETLRSATVGLLMQWFIHGRK